MGTSETLPNDLLCEIMSYLTLAEKLRSESVSERWRACIQTALRDETTLCTVELTRAIGKFPPGCVEQLLRRMLHPIEGNTKLKHLNLFHMDCEFGYVSFSFDACFPRLVSLTLGEVDVLPTFLKFCVNLQKFDCQSISLVAFKRLQCNFPTLQCLNVRGYRYFDFSSETLETIFSASVCSLRSLSAPQLKSTKALEKMIAAYPNLEQLSLQGDHRDCDYALVNNLPLKNLILNETYSSTLLKIFGPSSATPDQPLRESLQELTLAIKRNDEATREQLTLISACCNLRVLSLDVCGRFSNTNIFLRLFSKLLTASNFPFLEELNLPCLKLESDVDFSQLTTLKSLSMCACARDENEVIINVSSRFLAAYPNLTYFRPEHLRLERDSFFQFGRCLNQSKSSRLIVAMDQI